MEKVSRTGVTFGSPVFFAFKDSYLRWLEKSSHKRYVLGSSPRESSHQISKGGGTMAEATVCNCESLCIRVNPSKDADILYIVGKGSVLQLGEETAEGWYEVTKIGNEDVKGYCMKEYTKTSKEIPPVRNEVKNGRRT